MIDDELLNEMDDQESHPAIARLIELGRQKTYVTIDDILGFFPDAEQDVDQLEEAFAALISAGIPYIDETVEGGPSEEELVEEEVEEEVHHVLAVDDNYLANIDTDDTIGLYLKEVGRVLCSPQWRKSTWRSASSAAGWPEKNWLRAMLAPAGGRSCSA